VSRRYVTAAIRRAGAPPLTPFGRAFFSIWLYARRSYLGSAFSQATSIPSLHPALSTCCTISSGALIASSGCSEFLISAQVKLSTAPSCRASIRAIGAYPSRPPRL
jgi:hypothetical protein